MNSHKTAISRTRLSKPMSLFEEYGLLLGNVLDYGCGKGTDVEFLGIEGYDPFYFPELPRKLYDTVTMNYVINTITTHVNRMNAIREAWRYVDTGGMLIVVSRTYSEILKNAEKGNWKPHYGGYITSKETFQIGFEDEQIDQLLENLVDGIVAKSPVHTNAFSHGIAVKLTRLP